jgi:hypothetical protein
LFPSSLSHASERSRDCRCDLPALVGAIPILFGAVGYFFDAPVVSSARAALRMLRIA